MREIKFRIWDEHTKSFFGDFYTHYLPKIKVDENGILNLEMVDNSYNLMQYTGLKDKNGLQEVYEGDIIDEYGNIKGNIYEIKEVDKRQYDFIIQGFGDKNWGTTYKIAMERGCKDTE